MASLNMNCLTVDASGRRDRITEWIFSYRRGTLMMNVGRTSFMLSTTLPKSSAKATVHPAIRGR